MWVFGYGSLMSGEWEKEFEGSKHSGAVLIGYRRAFNKSSTRNWGTPENRCPTLGLERVDGAECIGVAFEFSDDRGPNVLAKLEEREGRHFELTPLRVRFPDGREVEAITPVNDRGRTYLGALGIDEIATLVYRARGRDGSGIDYVRTVKRTLDEMRIEDEAVEALIREIESQESQNG